MTSDPTPAEIEAGADALEPDPEMRDLAEASAERVLRAVLPDHDAAVRAETHMEIHQPYPEPGMGWRGDGNYDQINPCCQTCGYPEEYAVPWPCKPYLDAAAIARQHTTGEDPT